MNATMDVPRQSIKNGEKVVVVTRNLVILEDYEVTDFARPRDSSPYYRCWNEQDGLKNVSADNIFPDSEIGRRQALVRLAKLTRDKAQSLRDEALELERQASAWEESSRF